MATTTAYPHLFEISITLTFTASYLKRVIDTAIVYSRLFEFLTTLTFRALHGQKQISLLCICKCLCVYVNVYVCVYLIEHVRECAHMFMTFHNGFVSFCYISYIHINTFKLS